MLHILGIERRNNTLKSITKKIQIVFVILSIGFLAWNINESAVFAEEDSDGDGIPDVMDQCPLEKEDVNDIDDYDGCIDSTQVSAAASAPEIPLVDSDGDGISDLQDQCPTEKENVNDFMDYDGCTDIAPEVTKSESDMVSEITESESINKVSQFESESNVPIDLNAPDQADPSWIPSESEIYVADFDPNVIDHADPSYVPSQSETNVRSTEITTSYDPALEEALG